MLSDIIKYASEVTNIASWSDEEYNQLLLYINRAAKELYDGWDLPGSLYERYFAVNSTTQMVTLPWYVGEIRGIRRATYSSKIQLVDMSPRYNYRPWRQPTLQWRMMGTTPLEQNMTEAGRIVLTLAGVETSALTVTITGQTTTASMAEEVLTIEAGETTITSANQYTQANPHGIKNIVKDVLTTHDLTITQESDGRALATIPNHQKLARYQLLQVHDGNYGLIYAPNECVEILYKESYKTLDSDTDLFLGTEKFDEAVVWKLREHWHSTRPGEGTIAFAASKKCAELMKALCETIESGAEKFVTFGEDPHEFAQHQHARFARYGQVQ